MSTILLHAMLRLQFTG